jgi:uncharacterized protein DUF4431
LSGLSLLAVTWLLGTSEPGACAHFEPAKEVIAGKLVRRTFPGPPGYGESPEVDERETGWYVVLEKALCVKGEPSDELNAEDVNGIRSVQLVLTHGEYETDRDFVGKRVVVSGTLFTALTGHHHTPVLMEVEELKLGSPAK